MYSIQVSQAKENSPPMSQKRSQCQPEGKEEEGSFLPFLPAADLGIPHDMRCTDPSTSTILIKISWELLHKASMPQSVQIWTLPIIKGPVSPNNTLQHSLQFGLFLQPFM